MKTALILILLLLLLFLNYTNSFYISFPDEFDNLFGGLQVLKGNILYKDFFSHHGPVAYYFASLIELISGRDFFVFRIAYQCILWILSMLFVHFLIKNYGYKSGVTATIFFLIASLSSTYFWGHLLVADNLSGFFLSGAYITLFYSLFKNKFSSKPIFFLITFLSFLAAFTTYTFIIAAIVIYIFAFAELFFRKSPNIKKEFLIRIFLIAVPYLLYGGYLFLTKSFSDFYFETVIFNKEYYVYGEAAEAKNLLELAYLLFIKFVNAYKSILSTINNFGSNNHFVYALFLGNTILWVFLLLTRRFRLFLLSFLLIVYVNIRNEPLNPGENDYQATPYILISLFNSVFALIYLWEIFLKKYSLLNKGVAAICLSALLSYSASYYSFVYDQWFYKINSQFQSKEPIYQSHPVSPFLNSLINKEDYFLIGPFDPESNFYAKGKVASKYYFFVPAMDKSVKIREELNLDIERNKPKIVIFNTEYSIFGIEPGKDFIKKLKNSYTNLEDIKSKIQYKNKIKFIGFFRYDLERHFFIRKDALDEVLKRMESAGYLKLSDKNP
ncbi:hypothetical protein HYS97_00320 [Candidatus Daviesbacteria bacterium]|nr:hypothetical protein [Candidatus Daviesbacteria bacterium]